MQDMI